VLALYPHPRRLRLVARATRRLGLAGIHTLERDVSRSLAGLPAGWLDALEGVRELPSQNVLFDRALADVPCSGLGTLRRNPDARWRVPATAPQDLARAQISILKQTATVLRPGGHLVYSTCTLTPEENEEVVHAFLHDTPSFRCSRRDELPDEVAEIVGDDGFLRCLPHIHDTDGFFAVRFTRDT
jgi:16S rRNA (cytosine967-C5)-methyltransferase